MVTKSIRWRMQLWQAFLLVCILSGFGITAYQLQRTTRLSQVDEALGRRVAALSADVRMPFGPPPGPRPFERDREFRPDWRSGPNHPGMELRGPHGRPENFFENREIRLAARTSSLFDQTDTNDFYFAIWSRSGTLLKRSTNAPPGLSVPIRADALTGIRLRMQDAHREAFLFTELGECVLAGRLIRSDLRAIQQFAYWLVAAGGGVLALGLGGGWLLASRALRPVEAISAAAGRISAGSLSERINLADTDSELGQLAGVLNSTFTRLEAAFAQQKQFTADASHELRTPIAVIIAEAQTTLARERTAAEYRETVEACLDTAQQMRRLTHTLLELARYDAGQEPVERSPLDLAEQTRICVELLQPLAREREIQVHCDLQPAEALGDAERVRQVITNLLNNAIYYNRQGGQVHVTTRAESQAAVLVVADTGQDISAADLPHVFERFYRADLSRSRSHDRTGLGLAICKAILEAHGGEIAVASKPSVGTEFTVRLPKSAQNTKGA